MYISIIDFESAKEFLKAMPFSIIARVGGQF